ncbi:lysophospholipid acyltransferase family protein [Patescibacteria group bacterium]|nr:lysophospholipid acyltransferase family protein [Patescibacteria group bacterium]MBU1015908.1 lysophospholipid acyltransferase family protein [Patescibacteria group bacterium]MBU1685077.1 lysophospholipid acyltransferase family protein [Patescibacteria group bacterium]MBU1938160.1 lysophospholipid acyltransferase family protein [Patescibacteria group bacterium]
MSRRLCETTQIDRSVPPAEFKLRKALMRARGVGMLLNLGGRIYRDKFRDLFTHKKTDHSAIPGEISADLAEIVQCCMQLKIETHGDFPKLGEEERGIVIANHPSDELVWPWTNVIAQKFTPRLKAIAKKELLYDPKALPPIFGWLGKLSELMIMVDRSNRETSVKSIRESCRTIFNPGTAVCIFPDGHRPTKESIERSHAEMANKGYPDLPETMPYTCLPKSGGLMTILRATEGHCIRILNTTVGLSTDENGSDVLGSTAHIYGEEIEREALVGKSSNAEEQEKRLRQWLIEEWKRKNKMINGWRAA